MTDVQIILDRLKYLIEMLKVHECPHGGGTAVFHLDKIAANEKLQRVYSELKIITQK